MSSKNFSFLDSGSVTSPLGFKAGAVYAGIKSYGECPLDLGILVSEKPCIAAGVFTTNKFRAAPVTLCSEKISKNNISAIIINSGNANAATGARGIKDAEEMISLAANSLNLPEDEVIAASTGIIGKNLPMPLFRENVSRICPSVDGGHSLAKAIMTTDLLKKEAAVKTKSGFTIGGIAKGSGMIHPNMATMLAFITTDAPVEKGFLGDTFKEVVNTTFNMISVDGDTSPNDSAIIMANGLFGGTTINKDSENATEFTEALKELCTYLAKAIASDGEGATKLIEVRVNGAKNTGDARLAARAVTTSPLVKTAMHGNDPNWGRIIAAAGYSGAEFVQEEADLFIGDMQLLKEGTLIDFDEAKASIIIDSEIVIITLNLNLGDYSATAWGCDLTKEYITINSDYTT